MQDAFSFDPISERRSWIRDSAKRISRIFLALFIFELISYVLVYFITFALAIVDPDLYLTLADNAIFNLLLSSGSMYLVAFPVFYLIIRKMRVFRPEKSRLAAGELMLALFAGEALMLIGNYIGLSLMSAVEAFIGNPIPNSTADIIADTPMWLLAIVAVVIGPIVEELMFRKLIIDRLRVHGEFYAILVSSLAFGIFHQNIYQLFYASLLGMLLGYLYVKSGDIKKPIIIHMLVNLIGSIVVIFVEEKALILEEIVQTLETMAPDADIPYDMAIELYYAMSAVLSYAALYYGMAIAGFVILVLGFVRKRFKLSKDCPLPLDGGGLADATLVNVGVILFLVFSAIMTLLNIIVPILTA